MAVLGVRRYGDPVLRQVAKPVGAVTPEIKRIIADMVETMWQQVGIGLAAPQVGVPAAHPRDGRRQAGRPGADQPGHRRNRRGSVRAEEGCLSLPGIFADVERSEWIRVRATDEDGQPR